MLFRPFRNSDPPQLARIWRQQRPQRGMARQVTPQILDHYVFAKPYFDRHGLIVAETDDGKVVGFGHAGFGPNDDGTDVSTEFGVVCMIMVDEGYELDGLGKQLLEKTEAYLKSKGAKVFYGGGMNPLSPFYLGLYGGSELPGVLDSHSSLQTLFRANGYTQSDECVVMQLRMMGGFRMPVDRRQIQLKRKYRIELDTTPDQQNWWQSCASPPAEPTRFEMYPLNGGAACGTVSFWVIEPLSANWGALAVGLTEMRVVENLQRQGLATFLTAEALRQLQMNGVGVVEVQTMVNNTAAIGLYSKLGFKEVDRGKVFRKE